jgi:para-aminobenzoate synthetase component 1
MGFKRVSHLAQEGTPFLFISDFLAKRVEVYTLEELKELDIEFCIEHNYKYKEHPHALNASALSFQEYKQKFDAVIKKIEAGETYLLNLTEETPIKSNLSLREIYNLANASYKLRYKDLFVCFSPEKFIQIDQQSIHTYPMKGTIDASVPQAKEKILADAKEMAEHVMVVDLLRNDLSMVATDVCVKKFRYVEKIDAGEKSLLQVSSHIEGKLPQDWRKNFGEILKTLLPAGSISGAPKRSTVTIIQSVEGYKRGYYTGVFGFYDGRNFDSGVMIRFIEKRNGNYLYKSGGGITLDSDASLEYRELLDKIYLP